MKNIKHCVAKSVKFMKKIILVVASALLFTSGIAWAEPVYDNPSWKEFIEKNNPHVPDGFPIGKGCISQMNPTQVAQVHNPYDMTKDKSIVLSQTAIQQESVYASQTQVDFLHAMSDKLKEITKDKNIQIPIDALNHNTLEYPARQFKHPKIIRFGWFGLKNGNSVVVKNGVYSLKNNKITDIDDRRHVSIIKKYINLCHQNKDKWNAAGSLEERKKLASELYKKAHKAALRSDRFENQEIRENNRQEEIEKARERRLLSEDEDLDFWGAGDDEDDNGETWTDIETSEIDVRVNKAKKRREKLKQERIENLIHPDIPKMWALIEAALTQDKVRIAKLSIPTPVEEQIVLYGKKMNKPKALLDKILTLNKMEKEIGHISITLACSIRDRLLGCYNLLDEKDPNEENKLNQIIENLRKAAKNASETQKDNIELMIYHVTRKHENFEEENDANNVILENNTNKLAPNVAKPSKTQTKKTKTKNKKTKKSKTKKLTSEDSFIDPAIAIPF